jgi:hypothetical protein
METLEGAQGHVTSAGEGDRVPVQPSPGEVDQAGEVPLPEKLEGGAIARLELF